ncbi:NUDIX hydrolase [Granulosicoccus antarcticus]|uniref:Nudix hydrolase n=1 Tax=Granulosicoccus antarcticus IMCC3135 TaxID=1192854 RepID=A0A2Z2NKK7_9GAMM|nr:NUDIX domain-containing protein [Granulosicoccus antarcticus]ASJ71699.1 Nudix hydrolase [Granulosicoccus antarcticus IMCC3135]
MIEWLDIVDENDKVVGKAPRDQVHREKHLHRSAHIALFNSEGQIFVQLRSMNKDNSAGLWDTSAAGHVDSGETYEACAVRELFEELGVQVSVDQLDCVGHLLPEVGNGFEFTEIYTVRSDQSLTLQKEEIDDGCWVSPVELDRWILERPSEFTKSFPVIWLKIRPER